MSTISADNPNAAGSEQPNAGAVAVGLEPAGGPAAPAGGETPGVGAPGTAGAAISEAEQPAIWSEEFKAKFPNLAQKFASPDALAESYGNLERYFTAFTQAGLTPEQALVRLAQLRSGTDAGNGEGTGEETGAGEEGEIPSDPEAFLDFMAENPRNAIESVSRNVAVQVMVAMNAARSMWDEAIKKHPDMPQFEQKMQEILSVAPELVRLPDVVERIYFMVKGGASTAEAVTQARTEARAETLAQVRGTIVESGRGGASPPVAGAGRRGVVEEILFAGQGGGTPPVMRRIGQ